MARALGIDVEEWYHICGLNLPTDISDAYESRIVQNTEKILEILDTMQTSATFFVLGAVADKFPELVRKIDMKGHEIASHGYLHQPVYSHTPNSFRNDLKRSIEALEDIIEKPIIGYRAPDFSIISKTLWALDIMVEEGIKYDCSIFPIRHPRYGISGAPRTHYRIKEELIEFPPSTIRLLGENIPIAGGAYFRLLPYKYIKKAIENLDQDGLDSQFYLHVWEIDIEQPKLKIPFKRQFAHYSGIKNVQKKFEQLLTDFQYTPISQVIDEGQY